MLASLLGESSRDAHDELWLVCGASARLEWIRSKFSNVTDTDSGRRIQCYARAYFLYLVGCTLFSDKSGTRVFVKYMQLFEELVQVSHLDCFFVSMYAKYLLADQESSIYLQPISPLLLTIYWQKNILSNIMPPNGYEYHMQSKAPTLRHWTTSCPSIGMDNHIFCDW